MNDSQWLGNEVTHGEIADVQSGHRLQKHDQGKLLAKRTRRERTEEGTEEGTDVETHAHRAN